MMYRFELKRIPTVCEKKVSLSSPGAVWEFLKEEGFTDEEREHLVMLQLDTKNFIRGYAVVAMGSGNCSAVHVGQAFREAILNGAAGVIVAHNHPSGSTQPSNEDVRITQTFVDAGGLLSIDVMDHVIVGEHGFFSFREDGLMPQRTKSD